MFFFSFLSGVVEFSLDWSFDRNLFLMFKCFIVKVLVDGKLYEIVGEGNGLFLLFFNVFESDFGIVLFVWEYIEYVVGVGFDVKVVIYVEFIFVNVDVKDKI